MSVFTIADEILLMGEERSHSILPESYDERKIFVIDTRTKTEVRDEPLFLFAWLRRTPSQESEADADCHNYQQDNR